LKFHLCIYALEFDHEVFTTVEAVIFNTEFDDFRQIALQFIERGAIVMNAVDYGVAGHLGGFTYSSQFALLWFFNLIRRDDDHPAVFPDGD